MANHPNRNWRKRWQFDTACLTAKHDSGLIVQFEESEDDLGALDGQIRGDIPESLSWRSNPNIIAKLMRQAADGMAIERELNGVAETNTPAEDQ